MGKLYSLLSAFIIAFGSLYASGPAGYEWWIDNDVSELRSGVFPAGKLDLKIDTSDLPRGAHYFNCRLATAEGEWGSVYRKMFFTVGRDEGAVGYEYWFDNDLKAKETGTLSDKKNTFAVNVSSLTPGVHYFNCRLNSAYNEWGSIYRKMVFTTPTGMDAAAFEYWIDDRYSSKTEGEIGKGSNVYAVNLSGLRRGLHRFNYRIRTASGTWGSVYARYFYIDTSASAAMTYEYWLDNDYSGRKTMTSETNPVSFNIDLSAFDKGAFRPHFFNLRVYNKGFPEDCAFYRRLFVPMKGLKAPIIGYRHWMNGTELNYVQVERKFVDSYLFETEIPDSLRFSVKNKRPVFNGDRISLQGTDTLNYIIQVKTELGWSSPCYWDLDIDNVYATTAVEIEVNSRHSFATPAIGKFAALKFKSEGQPLYFRTDIPIALDLYRNGGKVAEINAEQLAGMYSLDLAAGEYYGILRDAEVKKPEQFTFHLMDTPNTAPSPMIDYEKGMVSISCSRSDAEIRYTVDGSEPELKSTLYSAPFPLRHNAVVKARAFVPDSDIDPSTIAEFVIDSYKTATPTGEFDVAKRLLTIKCVTEGAAISYTFSAEEEWLPYEAPIEIRRNRNVYAKATFEGFHDSDIAEIRITELPDGIPSPGINVNQGIVTIYCDNSDAEIRYTIDGTDPTPESTLYTGEFTFMRNGVIKAIAYIPDLDIEPSDITTCVIDSFKTETPTGEFNAATRLLTIRCATEGASISYAFSTDGEWLPYEAPIEIRRNRNVYAKATFEGYHDSDIAEIRITELPDGVPAPEITFNAGTVSITCGNRDAVIHYTTDGSSPTKQSEVYRTPFAFMRNGVIKAMAYLPNIDIDPSDVTTLVVDSYKTSTPTGEFNAATRLLTIRCATEGASISYSYSADGEWIPYEAPVLIRGNGIVYAKASFEGYKDSDVASIYITDLPDAAPIPAISFAEGMVTMTCSRGDAEIRYTLDNTEPGTGSTLYSRPFPLGYNTVVKARAFIPDSDIPPSPIAEMVVDSYTVAMPEMSFDSGSKLLTIRCETSGAAIRYSYDAAASYWLDYDDPVKIDGNCTVYAIASFPGYNDSEMAEITISDFKCLPVSFYYDGRFVNIETAEQDATILYTLDGRDPTYGMTYNGAFDVRDLCRVRAVVVKEGYHDSDIMEYETAYYADETHAVTSAGGQLSSCFAWSGPDLPESVDSYKIEGMLNDRDYAFISSMQALRTLDLERVTDARIPDRAFAGSRIETISMPADLSDYGTGIFIDASRLCAVIWNSTTMAVGRRLTESFENPNTLLYTDTGVTVEDTTAFNVVAAGRIGTLTLHDGYPFYAPMDFFAAETSFSRHFDMETLIGECSGWETIVLPFTPDVISHETAGPIVPFKAWDGDKTGPKPFWLYRSNADGWDEADRIEACVPYIISMPNNAEYVEAFNLPGTVTFSASGVSFGPASTLAISTPWKDGTELKGTFMPVEEEGILSLNVNATGTEARGSAFVDYDVTLPFGAYVRNSVTQRAMPVFGDWSDVPVVDMLGGDLVVETPAPGMIRVRSARERKVDIVTATGVVIRTLRLKPGEAVTVEGLTRDFYICGGKKIMVN